MKKKAIKIPSLGDDEKNIILSKWNVRVGDLVKEESVLALIETSNVLFELESGVTGEVMTLLVKEGDKLSTNYEIAIIDTQIGHIELHKILDGIGITEKAQMVNRALKRFPTDKFKDIQPFLEGERETTNALAELNQEIRQEYILVLLDRTGLDSTPENGSIYFENILDEIMTMDLRFLKKEFLDLKTDSSPSKREISKSIKWNEIKE